jgi:hypothetical protein
LAAGLLFGCGASLQSVYEGDVRFEHCMALDAQPSVKPAIRRACWHEWITFYTYGQTRDRLVHAQLRIRQLSGVSEFVEPVPGTSGHPDAAQGLSAVTSGQEGRSEPTPVDRCAGECRAVSEDCNRECADSTCRKDCSAGFRRCVRRCG